MPRRTGPSGRQIRDEWNSLVPAARARGLNVSEWMLPPETRAYGLHRLEWLRAQLAVATALTEVVAPSGDDAPFSTFTFGVELECFAPIGSSHSRIAQQLTTAGIPCRAEGLSHNVNAAWKVVPDGSLRDYRRGLEVVSPSGVDVLRGGQAGFAQAQQVCQVLTRERCTVRHVTGFHVHVGAATESVDFFKNVVRIYSRFEPAIDSIMAPSRRGRYSGGGFSNGLVINHPKLDAAATVAEVAMACGQSHGEGLSGVALVNAVRSFTRYCKVNLQSYWWHGKTVEFRQHQGTTDAVKVVNWVKLLLRLCDRARRPLTPEDLAVEPSLDNLLTLIAASTEERGFFYSRRNQLRGTA